LSFAGLLIDDGDLPNTVVGKVQQAEIADRLPPVLSGHKELLVPLHRVILIN
jgi:hypothetical protein